ncbi:hypothetical protein P8A21_26265 [Streptomyces poriferorum]|uniref:Uncharacterized protein n=1 Tax=Streptomyces poriferorum TaxID=2798799 RepID=A0ABY9IMZ6_9ACTN|nr:MULTISPECIES: hypothetical protein [Streptomyces]MBW5254210.1 hypothetical protein [Streptomyces poriferorum]MBW5261837.1 hypothetical protein [Streptomyces poriferorum]MDP5314524.1 hypothetical protein [Streptomyces sp. Alt4]WLQ50769.1 hypothetical protein P8A21_26265 [Streptomyces sp. Alt1]WLQ56565.1 hypothetical protein P8A19_14435 [Streptomyces sp. Alt2]
MSQSRTSRRALLTAAVAVPAAAVSAPMIAAPAAAADVPGGISVVQDWQPIVLAAAVTAATDAPAARVVKIAGTDFLQMRGGFTCAFTADAALGTLPAAITVPKTMRGVCPRNNSLGVNSCRVEVNTAGKITVFGATASNDITWVTLDSYSVVMA